MNSFDAWFYSLPLIVQIGGYLALFLIAFQITRWLFPARREVVKRKVKGESPGSGLRSFLLLAALVLGALWALGILRVADGTVWIEFASPGGPERPQAAYPRRWVPFTTEDPCDPCGRR